MTNDNLLAQYKNLEDLLSSVYLKYKNIMTLEERKECEEFLYEQGEYELAMDSILAIVKTHQIELDLSSMERVQEAKEIMKID